MIVDWEPPASETQSIVLLNSEGHSITIPGDDMQWYAVIRELIAVVEWASGLEGYGLNAMAARSREVLEKVEVRETDETK